jgi:26S proteasome regulatory subunit N1
MIKTEVAGATSSMTSVPKPLKYMSPMYKKLVEIYSKTTDGKFKKQLSNLVSVIAMVAADEDTADMLDYCISGEHEEIKDWGHEYMRSLAGHVGI